MKGKIFTQVVCYAIGDWPNPPQGLIECLNDISNAHFAFISLQTLTKTLEISQFDQQQSGIFLNRPIILRLSASGGSIMSTHSLTN